MRFALKNKMKEKRGQVTIFIIIGILIIVAGVLIYFLFPGINEDISSETQNPERYIQQCLVETLQENTNKIISQGGSIEPEHYIMYQGEKIEYLCYTEEYYKTCVVQQPMLKNHIEQEIKESIQEKADSCFNEMENSFEERGYEVNLRKKDMDVHIVPEKTFIEFNHSLTLEKETTQNYGGFRVVMNNNLYELIFIAMSIIDWETSYGDAETTIYMDYYRDIKVEKKKQSDGSTIYILSDRNDGTKLQFASRSIPWPPGYA